MRPFGAIPSPKDPRDYTVAMVTPVRHDHQADYRLLPLTAAQDQRLYSQCVAFALAEIKKYQERLEGKYEEYSPSFIYANRSPADWQSEGMIPREALKRLHEYGVCRWNQWPWLGTYAELKEKINPEKAPGLYADAADQKIMSYVQVITPDEVKTAITDLKSPVLCIVPVFRSWYGYFGGILRPIGEPDGYHAVIIVGWRPDTYLIQNSWGQGWGENGFGWLPYDYPITEMWAVTDIQARPPVKRIELTVGSTEMVVDGERISLDAPPKIENGRVLIPFRAPLELAGFYIDYQFGKITAVKRV